MSFDSKVVIVTGAGSGMGRASALEFARQGAQVLSADINADTAEQTAAEIRDAGGQALSHSFDLRNRDEVFGMVEAAVTHFGGLDVLANVGGVSQNSSVEDTTEDFWNNIIAINARGPLFAMQAAIPHLRERRGSIVNVASGAGFYAIPGLAAYGAAKAGLAALTRVVAMETAPIIRVNTVAPGPTRSPMSTGSAPSSAAVASDRAKRGQTIDRWLDPTEIADVIVWVSSDAARAVNGAILRVDGGHHML